MENIIIKPVMDHVEVFVEGKFSFSSDTEQEATNELKSQMNIRK